MTNLLTPLKKLGKKMTGEDISGTNLVTVVDDIANKYDGSGGGGGVESFVINGPYTIDQDTNIGTGQLDKTWNEIKQAVIDGKNISYYTPMTQINVVGEDDPLTIEMYGTGIFLDRSVGDGGYVYEVATYNNTWLTTDPDGYPQYPND